MTRHILESQNLLLLSQLAWSHCLLAFDFDGTLAPIVADREAAQMRARTRQLLASFAELGHDVVEMVLADQDGWDRYEAAKWLTMRRWLEANPGDDMAAEVRAQLHSEPVRYATYTREYLGWGVFALMAR